MRVLGIDPGTAVTGWGLIEETGNRMRALGFGAIVIPRKLTFAEKLTKTYADLCEVLERTHPDVAAIENVFFGHSARTALVMGHARGVAMLAILHAGVKLHEYEPALVKKSVVGSGRAHKVQVQEMVRTILGLREKPEPVDAADALAVAICHCHHANDPLAR